MRPTEALNEIVSIREKLESLESRNRLRSWSIAVSSFAVVATGLWQSLQSVNWTASGEMVTRAFVLEWASVFAICGFVVVGEVIWRSRDKTSQLTFSWSRQLARQLMPFALALLLVSLAALKQEAAVVWLPGIWSILVGLGLYSCNKLLPAASQIAAGWMIVAGGVSMSITMMHPAQPHLVIVATLGVGQAILAVTLLKGGNRHG